MRFGLAFSRLPVVLLLAALMACGGSGGGGSSSEPPPPSSNAALADLKLLGADFDQTFQANQLSYSAKLGYLASSVELVWQTADAGATLVVTGGVAVQGSRLYLVEGINLVTLRVTAADAITTRTYELNLTRETADDFAQRAYLKASNTDAFDNFGRSLAFSGDTLVIGAPGEDGAPNSAQQNNSAFGAGAVYVFEREQGVWVQRAYLKAPNPNRLDQFDNFGASVAIAGDWVAVGAPHEAGNGLSGNQGDNSADYAGAVYLYRRINDVWSFAAYVKASNAQAYDNFGASLAFAAEILAVGAPGEASAGEPADNSMPGAGAVYIFAPDASGWRQQAYLKALDADARDGFGTALSLDDGLLAVGAPFEDGIDGAAADAGAVYIFARDGLGWWQQAQLRPAPGAGGDRFGAALSLFGNRLAVGAPYALDPEFGNEEGPTGAAYVFTSAESFWTQEVVVRAANGEAGDRFGVSLALVGETLVIGAAEEASRATGMQGDPQDNSLPAAGAAYVFMRDAEQWSQQAYIKASNTDAGDRFGLSIGLAGGVLAVAATGEASGGLGLLANEEDNSAPDAGAVYLFR